MTTTRICVDCHKKFDVDPNQPPRKYPGVCDDCTAEHKETESIIGPTGEKLEFTVVRKLGTSKRFRD